MFSGKLKQHLSALFISLGLMSSVQAHNSGHLPPSIQQYIQHLTQKYHFQEAELTDLFLHTHFNLNVVKHISHPSEQKPWYQYREIFITRARVVEGVKFWKQHKAELALAERTYGVPAEVIIAIIGVETKYGKVIGDFSTMDALATLSFYYPARAAFFRQELTEYLLLTRELNISPLQMRGSYAGALGIAQFMPSTYRRYAVDYAHQGHADLLHKPSDAIMSVANYLHQMGWQKDRPIAHIVKQTHISNYLISSNAAPRYSVKRLKQLGIAIPDGANAAEKTAIIQLASPSGIPDNYWLTYTNFRSIMRYNPRINYAMAVYQLSEEIKNAYRPTSTTNRAQLASTGKD